MDLKDYLSILWRQKVVAISVSVLFFCIWYFNTMYNRPAPNWVATAQTFQANMTPQEYVYSRFIGEAPPPYLSLASRLELIKSETVMELAASYLRNGGSFKEEGKEPITIIPHPTVKMENVLAGLDMSSKDIGQQQIFSVAAVTKERQLSIDMANAIAFAFKKFLKDYATQKLDDTRKMVSAMFEKSQAKGNQEAATLEEIKKKIGYDPTTTRFEDRIRLLEERKSALEQRKSDAEGRTIVIKDEIVRQEQKIKDVNAGKGLEEVDVNDIKELRDIKSKIDYEYDKLRELEKRYSFEHPDIKATLRRIAYMQIEFDEKKKYIVPQFLLSQAKDKLKVLQIEESEKTTEISQIDKSMASIESQLASKDEEQKVHLKERDEYLTQQAKVQEAKGETNDYKKATQELEQKLALMPDLLFVEKPAKDAMQKEDKVKAQFSLVIFLSLIAGLSAIYLVDYLDNRVRTARDIKIHMNWPVVGVIPFIKTETERLIKQAAVKAPIFEVYNRLAMILGALFQKDNSKVIAIISISEKEGKTTIAANIATSFAKLGKKTILVDGDMRRPSLHKIFDVDNSHGLSTHLSGKFAARTEISKISKRVNAKGDAIEKTDRPENIATIVKTAEEEAEDVSAIAIEGLQEDMQKPLPKPELPTFKWEGAEGESHEKQDYLTHGKEDAEIPSDAYTELIRKTSVENLDLIPSGPLPANPVALVESEAMKNLLAYLKNGYDIVVVDSPPMESTTEPLIFSALVDNTFLVVSCWSTHNYQLTWGKRMLEDVNAKIGGVILNKSTVRQKGYYYYYYDYKYYTERE